MTLKVILERTLLTQSKVPDGVPSQQLLNASNATPLLAQEAAVTNVKSRPATSERVREFPRAERLAREVAESIREREDAVDAHADTARVDIRRHV
ncbi:MAG: hypothetical protein QY326_00315 [Bdellovibrionota bacterium]|nr:MAG: hypothetical protein QY326_00315 [Bdellovibrionota bacterium]